MTQIWNCYSVIPQF